MGRTKSLFRSSGCLWLIVGSLFILSFHGCAVIKGLQKKAEPPPIYPEHYLDRKDFFVANGDSVVGRLAAIKLKNGDTLPDIARHFSLGINALIEANPGVDVWVPKAGERIMLPLSFILPDFVGKGIVINLASMRLFYFKGENNAVVVSTYPVGVGTTERPTPMGEMHVVRKVTKPTWHVPASIAEDHRKKGDPLPAKIPPGPLNPLGEYALYLSKPTYLIHGTNKPSSIGLRATNGCIRLYPEDIRQLYADTPLKTPVSIINQPYLAGQRGEVLYLEAHAPLESSGSGDLEKIHVKLRKMEKETGRMLDWKKVKEVLAEARGIPIPISEIREDNRERIMDTIEISHPDKLYGKPEIPELKVDAWYVLAATVSEKIEAMRLAAIINHQGPQIPATVLSINDRHRVMAGPFRDVREAKDAMKRLKIDLELDGILVEPVKK